MNLTLPFRRAQRRADTAMWPETLPDPDLTVTEAIAALPAGPAPVFIPRHVQQTPEMLERVRGKLAELHAQARGEQFADDMARLPVFSPVAREFGWLSPGDRPRQPAGETPAGLTAAAAALLHTAVTADRQGQEGPAWKTVTDAADALDDAMQVYQAVVCGDIHPESQYPHLSEQASADEAYAAAVEKAGEEVTAAVADLRSAMDAHKTGTETTTEDGK